MKRNNVLSKILVKLIETLWSTINKLTIESTLIIKWMCMMEYNMVICKD